MKLNNGLEVKEEYYNIISDALVDEEIEPEDAIEFVYLKHNETIMSYKDQRKLCLLTKAMFVKTFVRLFENIGEEVFGLSTSTYVKCVSKFLDNEHHNFTSDEIEEINSESVWNVFSEHF